MKTGNTPPKRSPPSRETKFSLAAAYTGLLLLDASLKPIGMDAGAAAFLAAPHPAHGSSEPPVAVPEAMLEAVRSPSHGSHYRMSDGAYTCRAYMITPRTGALTEPLIALQFERDWSADEAIDQAAVAYQLTGREKQVLVTVKK